jgi:hypothetical protein
VNEVGFRVAEALSAAQTFPDSLLTTTLIWASVATTGNGSVRRWFGESPYG